MKTTFYIVRHGTTPWNAQKRWQGQTDSPLSEFGLKQGALLTGYFQDIPVDVGVSSPLQRARQTLEFALEGKENVEIRIEEGVLEMNQGEAEGKTYEEIYALYPEYALNDAHEPSKAIAPGGEDAQNVYRRMRDTFLKLAKLYPGKTIVVVSHAFAIGTFLNFAKGNPSDKMVRMIPANVSVSKCTIDENGQPHLEYWDDTSHIPEELVFNY
jgi:broad specificity phosphatase PhoE